MCVVSPACVRASRLWAAASTRWSGGHPSRGTEAHSRAHTPMGGGRTCTRVRTHHGAGTIVHRAGGSEKMRYSHLGRRSIAAGRAPSRQRRRKHPRKHAAAEAATRAQGEVASCRKSEKSQGEGGQHKTAQTWAAYDLPSAKPSGRFGCPQVSNCTTDTSIESVSDVRLRVFCMATQGRAA